MTKPTLLNMKNIVHWQKIVQIFNFWSYFTVDTKKFLCAINFALV